MLSEERHQRIVNFVTERQSSTIQQLMEELGASESTVRRDLAELDSAGLLVKVYGGAVAKNLIFDSKDASVESRKVVNHDAKVCIARYAASLIQDNDFVYLDAGTTTELMIDFLPKHKVVFVTNGFSHAKKLSEAGFLTYILGGEIKLDTESIVGEEALASLSKYHFTKGFWGTNGINVNSGFSTPDVKEALVKQTSMDHTQKKYVVSDSSKFSKVSCVTFAAFSDATIITANLENIAYRQYKNIIEVEQ